MKISPYLPLLFLFVTMVEGMDTQKPSHTKKWFSRTMSAVKYGIQFGIIGYESAQIYALHNFLDIDARINAISIDCELPQIVDFVTQELRKNGVDDARKIKIKSSNVFGVIPTRKNIYVFLPFPEIQELQDTFDFKKELEKLNSAKELHFVKQSLAKRSDEIVNMYRGALSHEAAHIRNNDGITNTIYKASTPIQTALMAAGLTKIRTMIAPKSRAKGYLADCLKPIWASVQLLASRINNFAYSRYKEQRADDQVLHDPAYLKGIADHLSRSEMLAEIVSESKKRSSFLAKLSHTHPDANERIAKLRLRAAKLEATQKVGQKI